MQENYYRMDLHIHTPSSSCYEGVKNDDEYIKILEKAVEKQLDIIAITDHNTINGYEKLMNLKDKLRLERDILLKYSGEDQKNKEDIDGLNHKIDLFNKLLVLPGVEITLNPGIHIIVIADTCDVKELSEILNDVGYTEDKRGKDSDYFPKNDVAQFLKNTKLEKKIIVAPHVDSNKGIYNDLIGKYRAEIFKSNTIKAITCNNPTQLQAIRRLITQEPEYKRDSPLAFINASDSHNIDLVGAKVSFANLDSKSFEHLLLAFDSPDEKISDISEPNLLITIRNIIDTGGAVLIEDANCENINKFSQAICACMNSSFNYLIIGVNSKNLTLPGIKMTEEEIEQLIDKAIQCLSSDLNRLEYNYNVELLGNGRNIVILNFKYYLASLWYIKDSEEVYIYDSKIKKANLEEIIYLVRNNTINGIKKYENNKMTIEKVMHSLDILRNPSDTFEMIQKVDNKSFYMLGVIEIEEMNKCDNITFINDNKLEKSEGVAKGNIYYASSREIRYKDMILRYSCPSINAANELESLKEYSGLKLIITDKGGTFVASGERWKILAVNQKILLLSLNDFFEDKLSIYSIIGWLKSSYFLWYVSTKFNTTNIFKPEVLNNLNVPLLECLASTGQVDNIVQEIISLEQEFLEKCNDICINQDCNKCSIENCINDEHNNKVAELTYKIDTFIFEELHLSDDQIDIISKEINTLGLYNVFNIYK